MGQLVFAEIARNVVLEPSSGLEAISESYRRAVNEQGVGALAAYALGFAAFLLFLWRAGRWVTEDAKKRRTEAEKLSAIQAAKIESLVNPSQKRASLRVPADVPMLLLGNRHQPDTQQQTKDLSADGVAFYSQHPPALESNITFRLDLGDERPIELHGHVVRIEPAEMEHEPALVAVKVVRTTPREHERLARWVTSEEKRRIARQHEHLCARCGRPMDETVPGTIGATHVHCVPPKSGAR